MIIAQIRGFDNDEDDAVSISLEKRLLDQSIRKAAKQFGLQDEILIEYCHTSCEDFSGKKTPYVFLQLSGPLTEKHERFRQAIKNAGTVRVFTSIIKQGSIY